MMSSGKQWDWPCRPASRVAWLVKTHMKFHYFANPGQGDVNKWLRREALGCGQDSRLPYGFHKVFRSVKYISRFFDI